MARGGRITFITIELTCGGWEATNGRFIQEQRALATQENVLTQTERFSDSRKRSNPNKVVWVIYIRKLGGVF